MSSCTQCHRGEAAPWDPDALCPRCRAQRVAAERRERAKLLRHDRTPDLPGIAPQPRPRT